jgi:hypothetical protein
METSIVKRDLSPALSEFERKIIEASKAPKVRDQPRQKLESLVNALITSVVIILGHAAKLSNQEIALIHREIVNDIYLNFKFLSFEELRLVFALGARGEYKTRPEDIVYFSVATVYNWLKSYVAQTKREAMQKQARYEQDKLVKKQPTEEEKKKIELDFFKDFILKPYDHYFETGEYLFDHRGNVIYNLLDKMKVIPFSVSKKKEIFERAKNLVLAQMEQYLGPDTKNRVNHIKEGTGPGHEEVVSKAKELALEEFFRELKEQGMKLEDFIELRK